MSCNYTTDIPWNLTFYFLGSRATVSHGSSSELLLVRYGILISVSKLAAGSLGKEVARLRSRKQFLARMRNNGATSAQKGWSPCETISFKKKKKNERFEKFVVIGIDN